MESICPDGDLCAMVPKRVWISSGKRFARAMVVDMGLWLLTVFKLVEVSRSIFVSR